MVCVIHGLFNDISCPGCREDACARAFAREVVQVHHATRVFAHGTDAELDRAYTTGAALVVERDALRAELEAVATTRDLLVKFHGDDLERIAALVVERDEWKARAEQAETKLAHDAKGQESWEAAWVAWREENNQLRTQVQRLEGTLAEQARALEELTKVCEVAKEDHGRQVAALRTALETVPCIDQMRGSFAGGIDGGTCRSETPFNPCVFCEHVQRALADPSLGADWVPQAELRRVAEAVREACVTALVRADPVKRALMGEGYAVWCVGVVDLDAIVRGDK